VQEMQGWKVRKTSKLDATQGTSDYQLMFAIGMQL